MHTEVDITKLGHSSPSQDDKAEIPTMFLRHLTLSLWPPLPTYSSPEDCSIQIYEDYNYAILLSYLLMTMFSSSNDLLVSGVS